jgi:hypothetical protein
MGKYVCISEVPNRKFTIGKIYDRVYPYNIQKNERSPQIWVLDDTQLLTYFNNTFPGSSEYFKDVEEVRNQKIEKLLS